jgi:hypothetical protein
MKLIYETFYPLWIWAPTLFPALFAVFDEFYVAI